jgi:hypothetical protein
MTASARPPSRRRSRAEVGPANDRGRHIPGRDRGPRRGAVTMSRRDEPRLDWVIRPVHSSQRVGHDCTGRCAPARRRLQRPAHGDMARAGVRTPQLARSGSTDVSRGPSTAAAMAREALRRSPHPISGGYIHINEASVLCGNVIWHPRCYGSRRAGAHLRNREAPPIDEADLDRMVRADARTTGPG